jgi:hypothetical protein
MTSNRHMTTTLIVRDVLKHFGEDFAILSLVRVCSRFGQVTAATFVAPNSRDGQMAVAVSFSTCEAAQAAFVYLNDDFFLFGVVVSASMAPPTYQSPVAESDKFLVRGASLLWAKVFFRRVKGVVFGPEARGDAILVGFDTVSHAVAVAACIAGRCTQHGQIAIRFVA